MVLSADEVRILHGHVITLLGDVGLKVDHEEVKQLLLAHGCTHAVDGRVCIPASLVADFVALQESRRTAQEVTDAGRTYAPGSMLDAFGPGPTRYYDYDTGQTQPVSRRIFTDMLRFADATPDISGVAPWFRQDTPVEASSVDTLVQALKITRKSRPIDVLDPAELKYLVEISQIVTGRTGDSSYVGGSQCMTPPMTLGRRAAQEMLERMKHRVPRYYIATMAMVGASAPVDLLGATALAAAEVLGGMCVAFVIYPEADLTGTAATTVLDMASGNAAMQTPETTVLDGSVQELFDVVFGGHVEAHITYAPSAKVPGLQAVAENYLASVARARLLGTRMAYAGSGTLDMGGVGSPVQAMLDIEILRSLDRLDACGSVRKECMSMDELGEIVRGGGGFLDADHTLRNFRALWSPSVFLRRHPGPDWQGDERALLDRCNVLWKQNLARYEPPAWDEGIIGALDDVLARARAGLS
jgi:trimethylamine---corrinoid protein Co-methyltransferase